jgi:hypothetical protein
MKETRRHPNAGWPRAADPLLARDRAIPQQADVLDLDFDQVTGLE